MPPAAATRPTPPPRPHHPDDPWRQQPPLKPADPAWEMQLAQGLEAVRRATGHRVPAQKDKPRMVSQAVIVDQDVLHGKAIVAVSYLDPQDNWDSGYAVFSGPPDSTG